MHFLRAFHVSDFSKNKFGSNKTFLLYELLLHLALNLVWQTLDTGGVYWQSKVSNSFGEGIGPPSPTYIVPCIC